MSDVMSDEDEAMLARLEALDALEPGELLPCPFCGGTAEIVDIEDDDGFENAGGSCVCCTRCQVSTAVVFGRKETLYSSWNERVSPLPTSGENKDA